MIIGGGLLGGRIGRIRYGRGISTINQEREREHALPLYSIVYFILLIILRVILHPSVEVGLKGIGSRDFRGLKMILMDTA